MVKLSVEEASASLVHPLQKERSKAFKNVEKWLEQDAETQALSFEELKKLFGACATCLYLTDGLKEQRKISVSIVKLTRRSYKNVVDGFAALLLAIAEFWEHIDCHRIPKFLLLIRIIVAELLFRVIACDFNEEVSSSLLSSLMLIDPIVKIPKDHLIPRDLIRGCSQTPAIILQVISVWFEEIATQLGGQIYIKDSLQSPSKRRRSEETVADPSESVESSKVAGRRTSLDQFELFVLCHPIFRCLSIYGQAENVWNKFGETVEAMIGAKDLFGDEESRRICFHLIGRCLEALVAGGLVTARNSDKVNKLRLAVEPIGGYDGGCVDSDVAVAKQWVGTTKVISFSS